MRIALFVVALLTLAGCQGIVGTNGNITGITVPPGCAASGEATFGLAVQGSFRFDCKEPSASSNTTIMFNH